MPAKPSRSTAAVPLPPLTARSIVLSALLGTHPPALPVRDLVRVGALFGVSDTTVRAALSRMATAGDLERTESTYRLTGRLLARQERQDAVLQPRPRRWTGRFEVVVVTASGRAAGERAALRTRLQQLGLAELREGVWSRPDNLRRPWPDDLHAQARRFRAVPDDPPAELVAALWDLPAWSRRGSGLLHTTRADTPAERFTLAAAVLRHLVTDPVLPDVLQPPDWPADELRARYDQLRRELAAATTRTVGSG